MIIIVSIYRYLEKTQMNFLANPTQNLVQVKYVLNLYLYKIIRRLIFFLSVVKKKTHKIFVISFTSFTENHIFEITHLEL